MTHLPMPKSEQTRRFGFCWDDCGGFGEYHDFWTFNEKVIAAAPPGSTIVEVGSYLGRSICCMGAFAKEANKGLKLFAIDDGSLGANPTLKKNIAKFGLNGVVTLIEKSNLAASKEFADNSCWLVFLDDDHRHEQVAEGIKSWMPKVRDYGWLTGHDALWHTVGQTVHALLGVENVITDKWQDIWIVRKREVRPNVDIFAQSYRPEVIEGSWKP